MTVLGGCGSSAADDKNGSGNESSEVIVLDDESENEDEELDIEDETQDESSNEALKAYYEILSSMPAIEGEHDEIENAAFGYEENHAMFGDHLDAFLIYDINKDGVPEFIASSTVNFRWEPIYVYTYADGQAVLLKDPVRCYSVGGGYVLGPLFAFPYP